MVAGQKRALRRKMRQCRKGISENERVGLSAMIVENLIAMAEIRDSKTIGIYASVNDEVCTHALYDELRKAGKTVCFPRSGQQDKRQGKRLSFSPVDSLDDLRKGSFDIPEPQGPSIPIEKLQVLVLPGLAFDVKGGRLGYGAGYYDATLNDFDGFSVGIAFGCQITETVPMNDDDRRVHAVVTENKIMRSDSVSSPSFGVKKEKYHG